MSTVKKAGLCRYSHTTILNVSQYESDVEDVFTKQFQVANSRYEPYDSYCIIQQFLPSLFREQISRFIVVERKRWQDKPLKFS